MRLPAVALAAFLVPSVAFACPGKTATADASEPDATHVTAKTETSEHLDATACAKKAELVGAACSYSSTGMMASRVLEQGKSFSYTGKLTPTDEALASQVAAPFVVGPEKVRVIANEVVESAQGHDRMTFQGKVLEVDGVQYFVVTSYEKASA